jgi:phosphoribosylamine--glycine ligase
MGAYSPAPLVTESLRAEIMESIIDPVMKGLTKERIKFSGVIYVGVMVCDGKPYVLEFNVRFGDPEAQPILARLDSDFFDLLKATAEGRLKGDVIKGLDAFKNDKNVVVFHAGTSVNNGEVVTSGGRVLGVTALGKDIWTARENAYSAIEKIHFEGMHYRKDIGSKAID